MVENKQFDRYELPNSHLYNNIRGAKPIGDKVYEGFFKCKLVHNNMFSVIVPDLIYIMDDDENFSWFQFFSFLPNHLTKFTEEEIYGTINVDIAGDILYALLFLIKGILEIYVTHQTYSNAE